MNAHLIIEDRYSATGRKHNGCDHCDGMGAAPLPACPDDPKWRAAYEATPAPTLTLRRRLRLLRTALRWGVRWRQGYRFGKANHLRWRMVTCPYCKETP